MSDALCGPSNALQNFQKHTTVDRTLQQDRLTSRHSPSQGFRSSPGPNAGILDAEFEAFQAGHATLPQPGLRFPPPQTFAPQFAQAAQAQNPGWASDFQRLSLNVPQSHPTQRHNSPQVSNAAASWHQDFIGQKMPMAQALPSQGNLYGGNAGIPMPWADPMPQQPAFGVMGGAFRSETAVAKQNVQEEVPKFDEAAFERAFAHAQQDALEHTKAQTSVSSAMRPIEEDPKLYNLREKRLSVYTAIKLRDAIDQGDYSVAMIWLKDLQQLESSGKLTEDVGNARWCVDALHKLTDREAPADVKAQAERLITAIHERLMSLHPLLSSNVPVNQDSVWEDLEAMGLMTRPIPERSEQPLEQQKEDHPIQHNDDELAATAGTLLERVADNTSEKFQNSQFLGLMRRLRDREVRVEDNKIVEVSAQSQSSTFPLAAASAPPHVDPEILGHSAQDFGMPIDSGQELGSSLHPMTEFGTDEISDQSSYYNTDAQYHR